MLLEPMISVDLIEGDLHQPRVRVRGEIDMLTVTSLRTTLGDIVRTVPPGSTLTIDAAGIGFLSVDGVRVFRRVSDHLDASGSDLVVAPVSAATELMLRVAGLARLLVRERDESSQRDNVGTTRRQVGIVHEVSQPVAASPVLRCAGCGWARSRKCSGR